MHLSAEVCYPFVPPSTSSPVSTPLLGCITMWTISLSVSYRKTGALLSTSVLSNVFIYWGVSDWWLWRRGRRGDCNNNNKVILIVILIKITDFSFYDSISWNILKFTRNNCYL
jgi:hypothetical protein